MSGKRVVLPLPSSKKPYRGVILAVLDMVDHHTLVYLDRLGAKFLRKVMVEPVTQVQFGIVLDGPFGHVLGQRIDRPQQIKSGDPCCVQELHQNAGSMRRQCTSCGLRWSDAISIGPRLVRRGSVRIKFMRTPMTSYLSFGVTLAWCTWFVLLCLFGETWSRHMFQFGVFSHYFKIPFNWQLQETFHVIGHSWNPGTVIEFGRPLTQHASQIQPKISFGFNVQLRAKHLPSLS